MGLLAVLCCLATIYRNNWYRVDGINCTNWDLTSFPSSVAYRVFRPWGDEITYLRPMYVRLHLVPFFTSDRFKRYDGIPYSDAGSITEGSVDWIGVELVTTTQPEIHACAYFRLTEAGLLKAVTEHSCNDIQPDGTLNANAMTMNGRL